MPLPPVNPTLGLSAMTELGSLAVAGVPIFGNMATGLIRSPLPGGQVYWVGNRSDLTNGDGFSAAQPLATLAEALALVAQRTGGRGDIIYVLPGHAENVDAADWASAIGTASHVSIIGLGTGTNRPSFTWTIATSTWLFDTAGIQLVNCRLFLAGAHAAGSALTVAAPITVSGAGCGIYGCDIRWGYDADQIVNQGIIVKGTDFEFIGNRAFAATAAAPTATFMTLTAADRAKIIGNDIRGATSGTTVGVIRGLTTASVDLIVKGNVMWNTRASSTIAFSPLAASTGEFSENNFFVNSGILPITASIGAWHNNYCVDTAGQAGALVGTAST